MSLKEDIDKYFNQDLKQFLKYQGNYKITLSGGLIEITLRTPVRPEVSLNTILLKNPQYVTMIQKGFLDLFDRYNIGGTGDTNIILDYYHESGIDVHYVNIHEKILHMDIPLYAEIANRSSHYDLIKIELAFVDIITDKFWYHLMVGRYPRFIGSTNPKWEHVYKLLLFLDAFRAPYFDIDFKVDKIKIKISRLSVMLIAALVLHFEGLDYLMSNGFIEFTYHLDNMSAYDYNMIDFFVDTTFMLFLQKSNTKVIRQLFPLFEDIIRGLTINSPKYKVLIERRDVLDEYVKIAIEKGIYIQSLFNLLIIDPYLYKTDPETFLILYRPVYGGKNKVLYAYQYLRNSSIYDIHYYSDFLNFINPIIKNLEAELDQITRSTEILIRYETDQRILQHITNIVDVINRRYSTRS